MIHTTNMCSSLCITYNALTTTYIYCKSISTQIQIASKTNKLHDINYSDYLLGTSNMGHLFVVGEFIVVSHP